MSDETENSQMTLSEFQEKCEILCKGLDALLQEFDDDTDPAGIAQAVVAKYLEYYGIGQQ